MGQLLADSSSTRPNETHCRSLSNGSSQNGKVSNDSLRYVASNDTDQTGNISTDSLGSYEIVPSQAARTRHMALVDTEPKQDRLVEDLFLPSIPPSDPPTAQDWEDHREIFTKLYRTEGRKLKDAKDIMEKCHSFRATYVFSSSIKPQD
jgi:Clr5 domain